MTRALFTPEIDAVVGLNLRRRREEMGLAVEHFAARLELPRERVAAAEAGEVRLTPGELLLVMARLHCSLDALFDGPMTTRTSS